MLGWPNWMAATDVAAMKRASSSGAGADTILLLFTIVLLLCVLLAALLPVWIALPVSALVGMYAGYLGRTW